MRRIAAAVLAAGAVVAVVVWLAFGRDPGPGPFAWPSYAGEFWVRDVAKHGQFRAFGLFDSRSVNEPATILDVRPLPTDDVTGLDLRYAACSALAGVQGATREALNALQTAAAGDAEEEVRTAAAQALEWIHRRHGSL